MTADPRWAARIAQNTPTGAIQAPLLITQGADDRIVLPVVTLDHARGRCARGERVDLRVYPGETHLTLAARAGPDILDWTAARFAGEPVLDGCRGL